MDKLFGISFGSQVNNDFFAKFVPFARQAVFECGMPDSTSGPQNLLKDVGKFLTLLCNSIDRDNYEKTYDHLREFLLFTGLLTDIDVATMPDGICYEGRSSNFHFHITIEVWKTILKNLANTELLQSGYTLSLMQTLGGIEEPYHSSPLIEVCNILLWDMIIVARNKFQMLKTSQLFHHKFFLCPCMKDLWIAVMNEFDKNKSHPFWLCVQQIWRVSKLNLTSDIEIDSDKFLFPPSVEWKNELKVEFWWWLVLNLTSIPITGDDSSLSKFLLSLIQDTLPKEGAQAEQISFAIKCLILMMKERKMSINVDVVTPFWERFFHKTLNEQLLTVSLGIKGLTHIPKSPSQWVQRWKNCFKAETIRMDELEQESLFNIFLILLGLSMPCAEKQIKGRIFSKFHERKMKSLNETGLINFTSLFLVMILSGTPNDTVNKMFDLYGMLTPVNRANLSTLLKGMLSALLIVTSPVDDYQILAGKVVKYFNAACLEFLASHKNNNPGSHHLLWTILCTYMDGVQDILDNGPLTNTVIPLVSTNLPEALEGSSGSNEISRLLQFVQVVLHKVRDQEEAMNQMASLDCYIEITNYLWKIVFPCVKQLSTTLTPPVVLADVAANFTLLAQESRPNPSTGIKEDANGLFNFFAINENVNGQVSCRYMCHLLPRGLTFSSNITLVQSWLRCCLLAVDDTDDQLCEFTRLVVTNGALKDFNIDAQTDYSPKAYLISFFRAVEKTYEKAVNEGLLSKTNYQIKIFALFANVGKCVVPALRSPSATIVRPLYKMCGSLVKHCGAAMYLQSKPDSPLPPLLKSLILPHMIYDAKKPLHPVIMTSIRESLHLFIQGLASIKLDMYIERCTRDIVRHYIRRYSIRSTNASSISGATVHPLVNSIVSLPVSDCPLRKVIYQTVLENFMKTEQDCILALEFISEVNKRSTVQAVIEDSSLLSFHLLTGHLQKQLPLEILQKILLTVHKSGSADQKANCAEALNEFLRQNFKAYAIRLLKIMETISNLCPSVITIMVPSISEVIRLTEVGRGIGIDTQLRQNYFSVLRNLGEAGHVEINRLMSNI